MLIHLDRVKKTRHIKPIAARANFTRAVDEQNVQIYFGKLLGRGRALVAFRSSISQSTNLRGMIVSMHGIDS